MGLIMETTEDKINELEDRPIEFTHYEQKRADDVCSFFVQFTLRQDSVR